MDTKTMEDPRSKRNFLALEDSRKPIYKLLFNSPKKSRYPNLQAHLQVQFNEANSSEQKDNAFPMKCDVETDRSSLKSSNNSSSTPSPPGSPSHIDISIVPSLLNKNENPTDSHDFWKLCTKARDALPNGARLENLTWRLMHMSLTKRRTPKEQNQTNAITSSTSLPSSSSSSSLHAPSKVSSSVKPIPKDIDVTTTSSLDTVIHSNNDKEIPQNRNVSCNSTSAQVWR